MNHISNSDAAWIAFAALFPVLLYLLFSAYQTRQRIAVRQAVIDKFSAGEDFAAFLQSPAGQKFVTDLSGSDSPVRAVVGAVQKGIVLMLLGGGVWWVGANLESEAEVASLGVLLLCVGAGLLISAGISYRMSKSLGLMSSPAQLKHSNTPEQ
jgi:hypothetical protein